MNHNIAFLFPGQGSQYVGMGSDIAEAFPQVRSLFEQADRICQKPVSRLCFKGPMDELTLTMNLQPAVTAVSLACLAALSHSGIKPSVSAGHSLGEYSALAAAGVLSNEDALALVNKRGELMHREALEHPGAMAAVMGLSVEEVEGIVADAGEGEILGIANHNTAEQIVITGEKSPVSRAISLAKKRGGKAILLKVSGAWHSPLMEKAVGEFRDFMEGIPFSDPSFPVLFNATVEAEYDPEKIKDIMARQLISPVQWYGIIQRMLDDGIRTFVEIGPKKVLTGLMKKIIPPGEQVAVHHVEDSKSLQLFLDAVG